MDDEFYNRTYLCLYGFRERDNPDWKPIGDEDFQYFKEKLGFEAPDSLRCFYDALGNGGLPWHSGCVVGLREGYRLYGGDVIDVYQAFREDSDPRLYYDGQVLSKWPVNLLPIISWNFDAWSVLDLHSDEGRVLHYAFDFCDDHGLIYGGLFDQCASLLEWGRSIVTGRMDKAIQEIERQELARVSELGYSVSKLSHIWSELSESDHLLSE